MHAVSRRRFNGFSAWLLAAAAAPAGLPLVAPAAAQTSEDLPLFDAHIHYSHDAWELVPPKQAIAILRRAGLRGAMVSSSNDDGNQMLAREAPDLIVPVLRPYRTRADTGSWVREDAIARYMEERLSRHRYAGVGEFHLFGEDADLPVPRRMVAMARERGLLLHAHSDADAIERLFRQWPQARVLWAHSGFDRPERVREVLRRHPRLWCDLAYRSDQASGSQVDPAWKDAFAEFPQRFMVGTDTFTPERWHYIGSHASYSRAWLSSLPRELALNIAWRNTDAMLKAPTGAGA